jgi:hypothetical protein
VILVAILLFFGAAANLLAAFMGMARPGELQSTMGRQLEAALGKRGAIAFWLLVGLACLGGGIWAVLASR